MSWLAFVASLVSSLGWPFALMLNVLLLRQHVSGVLTATGERLLRRVKAGPVPTGSGWAYE